MSGRLRAIYRKRFKKGPMDPLETATLVAGRGIAGNANQGGRRQVILLGEEGWAEATAELGVDLDPATRRGNLLLSGIDLEKTRQRILRIGPARLRIWTECTPCYQMDQAHSGLKEALRTPLAGRRLRRGYRRRRDPRRRRGGLGGGRAGHAAPGSVLSAQSSIGEFRERRRPRRPANLS